MMKWFDRSFTFDLPAWMWPNLIERLRGTPARLEERVHSLPPPLLTRRLDATWSIQEQVGHLLDLEELWIGRVDDLQVGAERLREADLKNRKTHEAGHNNRPIDGLLASFREVRLGWVHRLQMMDEAMIERTALHPRLEQPMRLIDLVFFVAEHDDHHLAQITWLKHRLAA